LFYEGYNCKLDISPLSGQTVPKSVEQEGGLPPPKGENYRCW